MKSFDLKGLDRFIKDNQLSRENDLVTFGDRCKTFCLWFTLFLYVAFFAILKISLTLYEIKLENEHLQRAVDWFTLLAESHWFYLVFVPAINFMLILLGGRYILSALLYPYQNAIIRESLDRNNATKFGQEFAHYLECLVYTLRVQAGMEVNRDRKSSRQSAKNKKNTATNESQTKKTGASSTAGPSVSQSEAAPRNLLTEDEDKYEFLSYTEVKNTIDLLALYLDINQKVIET